MLQWWAFFKLLTPPFLKFNTIRGNILLPWDGFPPRATILAAASTAPLREGTQWEVPTSRYTAPGEEAPGTSEIK